MKLLTPYEKKLAKKVRASEKVKGGVTGRGNLTPNRL